MDLKHYAQLGMTNTYKLSDRDDFKTLEFNMDELDLLVEMTDKELTGLLTFCGVRAVNGYPLCALKEDEKRLGYVLWRADQVNKKKNEVAYKTERGLLWIERLLEVTQFLANRTL